MVYVYTKFSFGHLKNKKFTPNVRKTHFKGCVKIWRVQRDLEKARGSITSSWRGSRRVGWGTLASSEALGIAVANDMVCSK